MSPRKGPPPGSPKERKYDYSPLNPPTSPPGAVPQMSPEPGDSEPFVDPDPLRDMLAQGGMKLYGEPTDTVPEEVAEFLSTNDLGKRYFQVMLKRVDEGASEGTNYQAALVKSFYRGFPSFEWITNNYGPGHYIFVINWKEKDNDGTNHGKSELIHFSISEKCQAQYEEYQRDLIIKRRKTEQDTVRQLKVNKQLDNAFLGEEEKQGVDPRTAAREYLQEITSMAKELGLSKPESAGGMGIMQMLPLLVPIVTAYLENSAKQRESMQMQFNNMITMMLSQSDKGNAQLLELVKVTQGQGSGTAYMKELQDMVLGAVDIKEALNGNKDSIVDKVFGVIENVLPQVLAISAQSKAQQMFDPRAIIAKQYVKASPEFQAVMKDPAMLAQMISKLDDHYGWKQCDSILAVAGIQRPAECPRDEAKMLPADERAAAAEPEVVEPVEETDGPST
jgi:hypothetical protein